MASVKKISATSLMVGASLVPLMVTSTVTIDGDLDGLCIRGAVGVGDLDGVGQHQGLGNGEVIERLGPGVKAPVKRTAGGGIGQIIGHTHHSQKGEVGDAGDVTAFNHARHNRGDGVGRVDIGQGQGTGSRQRAIGLGQGSGHAVTADHRDHRIVIGAIDGDGRRYGRLYVLDG